MPPRSSHRRARPSHRAAPGAAARLASCARRWPVPVARLALLAGVAACGAGRSPAADTAAAGDSVVTAAPAAGDTASVSRAGVPASDDSSHVDRGVCPFECCQYGRWTTTAPVALRQRPDSAAPLTATLAAGSTVDVPTGEVHVVPGRFVVERPLDGFAVGDTLAVFSPTGEGSYRVRRVGAGGALVDAGLESPDPTCGAGRASCAGTFTRLPRTIWWVEVRGPGAERGWTADVAAFDGRDSCA